MANLDFFAAEADQRSIVDFLLSATDVRIFESYSKCDCKLREFASTEQLHAAYPLGVDPVGTGQAILLQLWSPSVMRECSITRISLDPHHCDGHTFRYCIDGGGLIQLYFGGVNSQVLTKSHFGHWSEKGAQKWQLSEGIDWEALKKLSNRIQYQIRKLSAAKVPGCPVLPAAYELAKSGYALKSANQTPWQYEVEPMTARRGRGGQ